MWHGLRKTARMLFAILTLALAADPADIAPPALIETIEPVAPASAPAPAPAAPASIVRETETVTEQVDDRALVAGVSALGGAVGFGATVGAGIVFGTIASIATGGYAAPAAILLTVAALPLGSGVGATAGHALTSSDGAVSAGLAAAVGSIGGAVAGAGLGFAAGLGLGSLAMPSETYASLGLGLIFGTVASVGGGFAGAAIGPAIHAATE